MATSRAALRRMVGQKLREPFVTDIQGGAVPVLSGATTLSIPLAASLSALWPSDNYWRGATLYIPSSDAERRITGWNPTTSTLAVAPALPSPPAAGTLVEIHNYASATAKHDAINDALADAWPSFWEREVLDLLIPAGPQVLLDTFPPRWRRLVEAWRGPEQPGVPTDELRLTRTVRVWPEGGDLLQSILLPPATAPTRWRFVALCAPAPLTAGGGIVPDSDSTAVPAEYLVAAAVERLAMGGAFNSPTERWESEWQAVRWENQRAAQLKRQLAWPRPVGSKWERPRQGAADGDNPLGW